MGGVVQDYEPKFKKTIVVEHYKALIQDPSSANVKDHLVHHISM